MQSITASNYFHCCIRPKGLLYDAEHDLLMTAKLLVTVILQYCINMCFKI